MAKNTDRMIGPRRPVADPGRPLRVSGDLDQRHRHRPRLRPRRRCASAPTRWACSPHWSRRRVPVALEPGQAPNEKLVVAALQAALQGELQRTLGVAAPAVPGVVPGGGDPRHAGPAAAPPPDALDALIAGAPAGRRRGGQAMKAFINAELAIQAALSAAHELRRHRHRPRPRRRRARRARRAAPLPRAAAPAARRAVQLPGAGCRSCCRSSRSASSTSTAPGPTRWCRARCQRRHHHAPPTARSSRRCTRTSAPRSTRPSARSASPRAKSCSKAGSGTITGFLLRSRAVSGWPNLHVRAYSRDVVADDALTTAAESDPSRMKVLRMERLAPAVLLVLFDGVPAVVHIEEPRQGIQFGVRLDPDGPAGSQRQGEGARLQHRRPGAARERLHRHQLGGRALPARTRRA